MCIYYYKLKKLWSLYISEFRVLANQLKGEYGLTGREFQRLKTMVIQIILQSMFSRYLLGTSGLVTCILVTSKQSSRNQIKDWFVSYMVIKRFISLSQIIPKIFQVKVVTSKTRFTRLSIPATTTRTKLWHFWRQF